MLAKEIRKYITDPVLAACGWGDDSSRILVYGTGYVETNYDAIVQHGAPSNGGFGFYQTQPSDYADIGAWMTNDFNKPLLQKVLSTCDYNHWPVGILSVVYNIAFAALVCRIHYHRVKAPLPPARDAAAMARYHKTFYNGGALGKADVEKNTGIFERIIHDEI